MTAILVTYRGAPVALAGPRDTHLLGDLTTVAPGDPDARFALQMVFYAQLIARGELPGPYSDHDAQRFARTALIDPHELGRLVDRDARVLTEHFGVPLAQIHRAKREHELRNRARRR